MSELLPVRVTVEAWEEVKLDLSTATTVGDVKRQALAAVRVVEDPAEFLVKFRGAELRDESRTLADVAFPGGGALIVLRRRRRAVR
ncbi:MAG: hypothetical protein ABIZ70_04135 [Gemmatimonadales bacterium]